MENSNRVAYDPGWNDPPLFSYDSQTTQVKQEKRGTLLNKRVAFPLQNDGSKNNGPSNHPPLSAPPIPGAMLSPSPIPNSNAVPKQPASDNDQTIVREEAIDVIMNNLNSVLDNISENSELQEKVPEIRRRISMIEKLWKDGKFSNSIKQKILKLSEAIKSGDGESADHIQIGLMIDHAALCSSWMTGLRHLIHALRAS
ncbi:steroid receptor RNA activator 1 [Nilaparvata lugens]|uniref:steroid receptor RNA activator 1 n=1 Tax=Nilaparvata lugens TaxID=108931 RepID=UPI00193E82B9|nr:steroid receptor RNA activator 1 [Nilaparvata lugens]